MNNSTIIDKLWDCVEDMIGYANDLEKSGRKESGEAVREIASKIEHLCDWMYDHPKK